MGLTHASGKRLCRAHFRAERGERSELLLPARLPEMLALLAPTASAKVGSTECRPAGWRCFEIASLLHSQDFSKTNSVTLPLVEAKRGNEWTGHGLKHAYWERDGRTTILDVQGGSTAVKVLRTLVLITPSTPHFFAMLSLLAPPTSAEWAPQSVAPPRRANPGWAFGIVPTRRSKPEALASVA